MADKILKIKLQVDTSETGKFAKVVSDLESSTEKVISKTEKLKQLDKDRNALIVEQKLALAKLEATVSKLNSLQESGTLNQRLAFNAANTSVLNYNKALERTIALQKDLQSQQSALKGGYSFAGTSTGQVGARATEGTRTRDALTGKEIVSAEETARRIAQINESINRTSNAIIEQQNRQRLDKDVENARLAKQKEINSQSFATRLNSVPRVTSQGSQIDITGTLSRYLRQQQTATIETARAEKERASALDSLADKQKNLTTKIVEAVSIYRVYNFALNSIIEGIKGIPRIGIELESIKSALTATVGSETSVNTVLKGLNQEAERTGISVQVLRENFRTFSASATLAGESTDTTWRIFTNLNTTITSLHLSADQAQHTFLAFSQILNKGKVQSEELVKQLGNLLPGAFATMAKALNISTQQLSKNMKDGLVTAHDSLDAFAAEYAKQFSQSFIVAQAGLNSNIGRLQSSLVLLGETIYDKVREPLIETVKGMRSFVDGVKDVINGTSEWQTELNLLGKSIHYIEILIASVFGARFISKLIPVKGAMSALTGELTLAGIAAKKFEAGLSFLTSPTAILAGILLIRERLVDIIAPGEDLIERMKKAREEAEKLAEQNKYGATLTGANKLQFDVDNSEEVRAKFNEVKKLAEEIVAARERIKDKGNSPFGYNANDYNKDLDFIQRGVKELHIQEDAYVKLREEKKKQLEIDALAAKAKEKGNNLDGQKPEKAIKEVNFNKELEVQEALTKQENTRYKTKLASLKAQQEELEVKLKLNQASNNPVNNEIITSKINEVKNLTLEVEREHQQRLISIAKKSEEIIVGSVKKTTISVSQAFAKIQDIESAGVRTRGGRDGAVSITGALGKSQVQPSTLAEFTKVPDEILALEKKARFNLNVLKKKATLTASEQETLRDYALNNVEAINAAGQKLFEKLAKQFEGDFVKAAVAYNTGAARVKIASELAKKNGRDDFESFLPTTGKLGLNPRALAEAQGYAKKARSAIGGQGFDASNIELQTKQEEALDKIRTISEEKRSLALQKQLEQAELLKKVKEEEIKLNIESLESGGNAKEAELAKIKAEFEVRYAEAVRLGSSFLVERLKTVEKEKINRVELKALQDKFNQNETIFHQQVQELTNKSLIGRLKNYQVQTLIAELQAKYIETQREILNNELQLTKSSEDKLAIENQLAQLKQKQVETAAFNQTFNNAGATLRPEFENNTANIEASRTADLDLLNQEASLVSFEVYQQRKQEIEDKYTQASLLNNAIYYQGVAGMAVESFSNITKGVQMMFGEQSTAARAAFALQKTAAVGQATMQTYIAANKALAEGGPYLGPALAAIAVASGLANVAMILTQPLPSTSGIAHGGLENVPKESTYLLDKGERVLSPKQNVDITNKVTNINNKVNNSNSSSSPNIRIVNVADESLIYNALESDQSEKIIMNIVRRNR